MDKNALKKLQKTEFEILLEIVRICEKHNLMYFLIGGTLLGAIRHKGFIPWDDDLDIAMPRKDYTKFLDICKDDLHPNYFLHCTKTDKTYWQPFAKIKKNGTVFEQDAHVAINTHKGIFVDIFPLDNACKQKSIVQYFQALTTKSIRTILIYKRGLIIKKKKIFLRIISFLVSPLPICLMTQIQEKIMRYNTNPQSRFFINLASNYNYTKQTIPKEDYLPPQRVVFEGMLFNAPNNWNYILTRIYGDYMKLPPPEKRSTHQPVRIIFGDEPQSL